MTEGGLHTSIGVRIYRSWFWLQWYFEAWFQSKNSINKSLKFWNFLKSIGYSRSETDETRNSETRRDRDSQLILFRDRDWDETWKSPFARSRLRLRPLIFSRFSNFLKFLLNKNSAKVSFHLALLLLRDRDWDRDPETFISRSRLRLRPQSLTRFSWIRDSRLSLMVTNLRFAFKSLSLHGNCGLQKVEKLPGVPVFLCGT